MSDLLLNQCQPICLQLQRQPVASTHQLIKQSFFVLRTVSFRQVALSSWFGCFLQKQLNVLDVFLLKHLGLLAGQTLPGCIIHPQRGGSFGSIVQQLVDGNFVAPRDFGDFFGD